MKRIFEYIGGIPIRLRFDNMTTAVAQVLKDGERVLTEALPDLCSTAFSGLIFAIRLPATKRAM